MYDVIVVGQGLAGTALAFGLIERGYKVHIIDDGHISSASMVAAGMWNPIVFKRITKAWKADECLQLMEPFYGRIEKYLGVKLLHHRDILKFLPNVQTANNFDLKSADPLFQNYLSTEPGEDVSDLNAPFGFGRVTNGGYVDLPLMLTAFKKIMITQGNLSVVNFDESLLKFEQEGVEYEGIKAKQIICCVGTRLLKGKLFGDLPLNQTKGEVLTLSIPNLKKHSILNNGKFLLPIEGGEYRLGSTYEWNTEDLSLSKESKDMLISELKKMSPYPFEITDHKAGIRPTVKDRRPLLGRHPQLHRVYVFNGLGTRGVLIAPWLVNHFLDFFEGKHDLTDEVNIQRFNA